MSRPVTARSYAGFMNGKLDGLTAARIRLFKATGIATPRLLPFDRPSDLRSFSVTERRLPLRPVEARRVPLRASAPRPVLSRAR